jgi:hypothetical protein
MPENPIPDFYVREETTAGPLYFWPLPAVRRNHFDLGTTRDIVWLDDDGNVAERRGGYLITRALTAELIATWTEPPKLDHYRRKADDQLGEIARATAAVQSLPATLTPAEYRGGCKDDDNVRCEDCMWCSLTREVYERVMGEPTPRQHAYPVRGLTELDIYQADPAPGRGWRLLSPGLAAFYPQPAHHQFPGELDGVFAEVAEAVKAAAGELGIPVEVNVWNHSGEIGVSANIPWDEPLPRTIVKGRSKRARELNAERLRAATIAQRWHRTTKVPNRVAGTSKADALAKRDELVATLVAKLVPPHTVACDKCRGFGYVR